MMMIIKNIDTLKDWYIIEMCTLFLYINTRHMGAPRD